MSKLVAGGTYEIDPAATALPTEAVRHLAVDHADGPSCSHTWPNDAPSSEPCPSCGVIEANGPPPILTSVTVV